MKYAVIVTYTTGEKTGATVTASGCAAAWEKIFEMFYTTGHKSADGKRGMGLGLPLCRAILSAHKGTIEVLDNKPAGSIFRLTLPAKEVSLHE